MSDGGDEIVVSADMRYERDEGRGGHGGGRVRRGRGRPRKSSSSLQQQAVAEESELSRRKYEPRNDSETYAVGERPLFAGIRDEWEDGKFSDVQIYCKDGAIVKSHRIILATLSHMLRKALVLDPTFEEDSVVIMPDVPADVLADFLENIYMGSFEDVMINAELDYLRFADTMVQFSLPDPGSMFKMEPTDYKDDLFSQNYMVSSFVPAESAPSAEPSVGNDVQDDDPDFVDAPRQARRKRGRPPGSRKTLVDRSVQRLTDKNVINEREEEILREREANPAEPHTRRGKPVSSNVWKFFETSATKGLATCVECGKKFKNTSGATTTLRRHLQNVHEELFERMKSMDIEAAEKPKEEVEQEQEQEEDVVMKREGDVSGVVATKKRGARESEDDGYGNDGSNENEKSSGRGKRSGVWKFFSLDSEDLEENKALCNLCQKVFLCSISATTNLVRHLEAKHPEAYTEFRDGIEEQKRKVQEREEEFRKDAVISVETVDTKSSRVWDFFDQEGLTHIRCRECGGVFKCLNGATSSAFRHLRQKHPKLAESGAGFRNESIIWQFFDQDNEDENCGICIECKSPLLIKNQDTKYLIKHLEGAHPSLFERYNELMESQGTMRQIKVLTKGIKKKRAVIWSYFDRTPRRDEQVCKACLKVFHVPKKHNAANVMVRHLKQFHERLYDVYMKDCGYKDEEIKAFKVTRKRGPRPKSEEEQLKARVCPDCKKIFSSKKNMEMHLEAVHSGIRPFACDECGMTFARKESFRVGKKTRSRKTSQIPLTDPMCFPFFRGTLTHRTSPSCVLFAARHSQGDIFETCMSEPTMAKRR